MTFKPNKTICLLMLMGMASIILGLILNIISPSLEGWCKNIFGAYYELFLFTFFIIGPRINNNF